MYRPVPIVFHFQGKKLHNLIHLNSLLTGQKKNLWTVLKMKIWIYWSESNSLSYFYILLNKNWKIYWFEQSLTGLGLDDRCSSRGLSECFLHFYPFKYIHLIVKPISIIKIQVIFHIRNAVYFLYFFLYLLHFKQFNSFNITKLQSEQE